MQGLPGDASAQHNEQGKRAQRPQSSLSLENEGGAHYEEVRGRVPVVVQVLVAGLVVLVAVVVVLVVVTSRSPENEGCE